MSVTTTLYWLWCAPREMLPSDKFAVHPSMRVWCVYVCVCVCACMGESGSPICLDIYMTAGKLSPSRPAIPIMFSSYTNTHTITHTSTHTRNIQTHYTFMDLRYVSGKTNDSAAPVNQQTGYNYLHISSPVPNINAHILLALERQAPLWRQKCFRCHSIFILYL